MPAQRKDHVKKTSKKAAICETRRGGRPQEKPNLLTP